MVSIQLLLTSADIKLNSVTTLYYVSPACLVFLCLPFSFIEMPKIMASVVRRGEFGKCIPRVS